MAEKTEDSDIKNPLKWLVRLRKLPVWHSICRLQKDCVRGFPMDEGMLSPVVFEELPEK